MKGAQFPPNASAGAPGSDRPPAPAAWGQARGCAAHLPHYLATRGETVSLDPQAMTNAPSESGTKAQNAKDIVHEYGNLTRRNHRRRFQRDER